MTIEEKKTCVGLMVVFLMLVAGCLTGCSFKIEALYHGKTPVGISDTKATAMRAEAPRVVNVRRAIDPD